MKHFITEIQIEELRHLSNISIQMNREKKQHLIITGKNGSGKTTLLLSIQKYLSAINDGCLNAMHNEYKQLIDNAKQRMDIKLNFSGEEELESLYAKGKFITAYFAANRKTVIERPNGVENVKLEDHYGIKASPGNVLLKYMVHPKTQQSYARNEGDMHNVERIQMWFDRFESALRVLLDDESVFLEYDYKEYDFKIHEDGRDAFRFNELSDGYSSLINIVSDLILRMDKNWILEDNLSTYDMEGIVLIDELETHLHIELQKKILPFLTEFFPEIQFIITTYSPYILTSISNAKCYDLENNVELDNLSFYSSDEVAEGYFNVDEYSEELKQKIWRYQQLLNKRNLSEDERAERAEIRLELKNVSTSMAKDIKSMIEDMESSRRK